MNTIFRSVAIPYFIILLVVVIVVKLLSLGLFYFLPYNGVDHTNANKQTAKYRHFNIKTMISKKNNLLNNAFFPCGVVRYSLNLSHLYSLSCIV